MVLDHLLVKPYVGNYGKESKDSTDSRQDILNFLAEFMRHLL